MPVMDVLKARFKTDSQIWDIHFRNETHLVSKGRIHSQTDTICLQMPVSVVSGEMDRSSGKMDLPCPLKNTKIKSFIPLPCPDLCGICRLQCYSHGQDACQPSMSKGCCCCWSAAECAWVRIRVKVWGHVFILCVCTCVCVLASAKQMLFGHDLHLQEVGSA